MGGFSLALGLLELSLQLIFVSSEDLSYAKFLVDIKKLSDEVDTDKSIFFVGDSTIYGIGTTEQHLYSLPVEFERLLRLFGEPDWQCFNLGRPSSPTDFHLKILSSLPTGATVIYRGGFVDKWYYEGRFCFYTVIGGRVFEIRTMKMLTMLFGGWLKPPEKVRRLRLFNMFRQVIATKKLNVYVLGYSVHDDREHSIIPYCQPQETEIPIISLRESLLSSPFAGDDGLLLPKYRNLAGSHPNDAGYHIEAKILFNYFCRHGLLSLNPKSSLHDDDISYYMRRLEGFVTADLAKLKALTLEDFQNPRFGTKIGMQVYNLYMTLDQLKEYQGFEHYQKAFELAEVLVSLVFYNNPSIGAYLLESYFVSMGMSQYSAISPDPERIKLFFAILQAVQAPGSEYRLLVEDKIRASNFPGRELVISFFIDTPMYPLEFCERFIKESGFDPEQLGAKEAWEYFFNTPYEAFQEIILPVCQL